MNTDNQTKKTRRMINAREKAQAILAVWSGRRRTSRICKDLGVSWGVLNSWEKRALAGMLKGLGGEAMPAQTPGELGNRLESLLAGMQSKETSPEKKPDPMAPESPAGTMAA